MAQVELDIADIGRPKNSARGVFVTVLSILMKCVGI